MKATLTQGNVAKSILRFSFPLLLGSVVQQLYGVADSVVVGRFLGADALAAVGSSFTIVVFLTSIMLGLCMGAATYLAQLFGAKDEVGFKNTVASAFLFIGAITVVINILVLLFRNPILRFLHIPQAIYSQTYAYISVVFYGFFALFLYNYFTSVLRATGNSMVPFIILLLSATLNVAADIILVAKLGFGITATAWTNTIAQCLSAIGTGVYCYIKLPHLFKDISRIRIEKKDIKAVASYSVLSSVQQSIMNLGILLIQGLVNTFGVAVMAAFTVGVKIEAFAYMPLQEYGNAFSTFVSQNYGAQNHGRIKEGVRVSAKLITLFGVIISALVILFAPKLMLIFVKAEDAEIIRIGMQYLRLTGIFYVLIGYLFSFYGYFRGMGKVQYSVLLTVISLGLRVLLAYSLAPMVGVTGIWWAIPIGWFLADATGIWLLCKTRTQ